MNERPEFESLSPTPVKLNRWVVAGAGAVVGLAIGIGVSLVTDVPLTPEVGILAGGCIGYVLGGVFKERS